MSESYESIVEYNRNLASLWEKNHPPIESVYTVISDSLVERKVVEIPKDSKYMDYLEQDPPMLKQCYDNALAFVMKFPDFNYVLGYSMSVIPVTHAWVSKDGVHYDPTAQILDLNLMAYGEVKSFNFKELMRVIGEVECAPMLEHMHVWAGDACRISTGGIPNVLEC